MNDNINQSVTENSGTGNLIVKVTEANNSVPIKNALVLVTKESEGLKTLYGIMITDNEGQTPSLSLPAPSAEISQQPSSLIPYEIYYVQVSSPGYYIEDNHMVQIFGDSKSYLQINLIPLPEYPEEDVIVY